MRRRPNGAVVAGGLCSSLGASCRRTDLVKSQLPILFGRSGRLTFTARCVVRMRAMDGGTSDERNHPRVVILGGAPATGKTTLATAVARSLQVPLLAKDLIKESLLDSFGATDLRASQKVGAAGWELLFLVAAWLLDARVGFVIEGNFEARATSRLRELARRSEAIQVICQCSDELSQERYERRASASDRHPGIWTSREYDEGNVQSATSAHSSLECLRWSWTQRATTALRCPRFLRSYEASPDLQSAPAHRVTRSRVSKRIRESRPPRTQS